MGEVGREREAARAAAADAESLRVQIRDIDSARLTSEARLRFGRAARAARAAAPPRRAPRH